MKDSAEQWEELQQQAKADKQARQEHWQSLHREANNMMNSPEQTAEQKAAELADTLIERLDKMPSLIPVDEARETILDATGLVELVKCKESYEQLKANGPKCSGCAAIMFTGGLWPETPHDDPNCLLKELGSLRAKVQELENLGQSFREFCLMNPDKVHDIPDDVWIPFSQGFKSAFAIDNAREGKPTSAPEHSPENRTTDP